MIALHKHCMGPWEIVRGYVRDDLEAIETSMNQRWAATFGDKNQLKVGALLGTTTTSLPASTLLGRGSPLGGNTQTITLASEFIFVANGTQLYDIGGMIEMFKAGQGVA